MAIPRRRTDHLRVCGADAYNVVLPVLFLGSSPRVRSRPRQAQARPSRIRIISACAEQTLPPPPPHWPMRDHLRVCGADSGFSFQVAEFAGSSPRVRSRRACRRRSRPWLGIISACAEQTRACCTRASPRGDHLRVCGADPRRRRRVRTHRGSSPRVRSRPVAASDLVMRFRIISACAEQTTSWRP